MSNGCFNTCCIFGHRSICESESLHSQLLNTLERLITEENVQEFLFGSKSDFDRLCLALLSQLKERYPQVKRIYVRAEFPYIDESYKDYLLRFYDETYYPPSLLGAGRASYVKRNYEMIDRSRFCLVYCNEACFPTGRKSGTKIALAYAVKKKKEILLFP